MAGSIRVLIVDDSALVREVLARGLSGDPEITVIGRAADPYQARDMIIKNPPDVITLDVEMPRMDGVEFLTRLMLHHPIPTVMVSSLTKKSAQVTFDALAAGAIDFVTKPSTDIARGLETMITELRAKVKTASVATVRRRQRRDSAAGSAQPLASQSLAESTDKVIAIGASTGGTEAIREVITAFPPDMPGVVIVQHMPVQFTKMFSERMHQECAMDVKEAETGDRVMPGQILIAPGGSQMELQRSGGIYRVRCFAGELVCGHMPSVEVLFRSVAKYAGANAIGVMLTGMGSDGADGMKVMRDAGSFNIAQDEATSVVFGMPNEAYKRGGAERLVPLQDIAGTVRGRLLQRAS